jgi:hypothetical protein
MASYIGRRKFLATLGGWAPECAVIAPVSAAARSNRLRLYQRETSLEARQVFMAGPDDEQVEALTFLGGPVTHNGGGPLRVTASKNEGEKCTVGCT